MKGGTSSLHLIIHVLGIGPGDEVITTPFSFNASTNCILMEGAVSVFADIDPVTLCIDPDEFDNGRTPACRVAGQTGLRLPVQSWQTVSKDRQVRCAATFVGGATSLMLVGTCFGLKRNVLDSACCGSDGDVSSNGC